MFVQNVDGIANSEFNLPVKQTFAHFWRSGTHRSGFFNMKICAQVCLRVSQKYFYFVFYDQTTKYLEKSTNKFCTFLEKIQKSLDLDYLPHLSLDELLPTFIVAGIKIKHGDVHRFGWISTWDEHE